MRSILKTCQALLMVLNELNSEVRLCGFQGKAAVDSQFHCGLDVSSSQDVHI
jgi:hypothetical protein